MQQIKTTAQLQSHMLDPVSGPIYMSQNLPWYHFPSIENTSNQFRIFLQYCLYLSLLMVAKMS